MEEAEAFLKKTKAKHFKNPYDCCITKEYVHAIYFDCISDEIFNSLEKDIQLKETVINKKKKLFLSEKQYVAEEFDRIKRGSFRT